MVAALALVVLFAWERRARWMKPLLFWPGPLLAITMVLPWLVSIQIATDGGFLRQAIGDDMAPKLVGAAERHGGIFGYHLLLLPLLFGLNLLIGLGAAVVFGLGLPRWVVGMLGNRRRKKFSGHFADAVDVIVRGIKSGLPVHDCFKIIARESPAPLGPEFQKLVEGLGVGLTLAQALDRMYERMPTPELKFFSIVIAIQQKTGGNLAEALNNLSVVLRARKMMGEKIKALSSEATASAGIIGSLPPAVMILVSLTTPAYMARLFTDPRGQFMLLIAVTMMAFGIFVMKKMIAFKF